MNDHVAKPVDPDVLYRKLARWLSADEEDPNPTVSATVPAETAPVLDIDAGLRYWRNPEKYRKFLGQFARDHAHYAEDLASRIDAGDFAEVGRQTHTLKGFAATFFGLMELAPIVVELDHALKFRDTPAQALEELVTRLRQSMARCLAEIRDYTETTVPTPEPELRNAADPAAIEPLLRGLLECLAQNNPYRAEPLLRDLAVQVSEASLAALRARLEAISGARSSQTFPGGLARAAGRFRFPGNGSRGPGARAYLWRCLGETGTWPIAKS